MHLQDLRKNSQKAFTQLVHIFGSKSSFFEHLTLDSGQPPRKKYDACVSFKFSFFMQKMYRHDAFSSFLQKFRSYLYDFNIHTTLILGISKSLHV